ncbi:MAG: hypothetical protein ABEK10_00340 [Candidatus Nanosalina sp.]
MDEENLDQLRKLTELLSDRQALDLLLVVTGSRPACLVMDPSEQGKKRLVEFCRSSDLYHRIEEDRSPGLGKEGFFITRNEKRLEKLNNSEGRFYGLSDRHVGEFLGFPEEDVDYFHENINKGPVEPETRRKKSEMKSRGMISEKEEKISEIVSYVPKPSESRVKHALSRSRSYIEDIREFDCENSTNLGSQVLENFLGVSVKQLYTP